MVLALLTGRPAADILDTQRAEHLRLMRELTRRKAGGDLADQLICDHALFHLEADLRWLELTAARLDELARGGAGDRRDGALLRRRGPAQDVRRHPRARRRRVHASAPARSSP